MIKNHLQSFNILTDNEIENFIKSCTKKNLKKNDYFIREGEICREVAFILSGILRSYYVTNKGEEITYCITFPNNLMTAYSSFITGQSTEENMKAITSVELMVIQKNKINELASENYNWIFIQPKIRLATILSISWLKM